jgi:CDP-diacylglycerol--glycerol-3-phosphate 3-phosphatidyltransferase
MISDAIGRAGLALKAVVAGAVGAAGIPPNVLTLSSLIPMALAAWNLGHGNLASAAAWTLVGGVLDLIDGAVARLSGKTSTFGGVLDSVVDRASDTLVYVGGIYYFQATGQPLYVTLGAVALGGAIGVSYTRARAENVIPECRVGFTERGERLALIILGLYLGRLGQAFMLLAFLAWLTTVQRLLHAYRVIGRIERAGGVSDGIPEGLDVWGTFGRWLFLNWPRGSWQYDIICGAILAALWFLPHL